MLIKQVSIFIENEKGKLAEITELLKNNNIDIRAISVFESLEYGILRLVVSDTAKAVKLLRSAGHVVKQTDMIAIALEDTVGSFHNIFKILTEADVNVEYVYSYVLQKDSCPLLVVKTEDQEKSIEVLKAAGLKIMSNSEINQ
jgi:hypothetical protein